MLNNQEFISLERRLWAEGNPLCDELVSTRDELLFLLSQTKKVMQKYSPFINECATDDDGLEFFKEWDEFCDSIDNLTFDLGVKE
jgi:hypothetical protein